jgi:rRNA-processing protein FCF1
VIELRDGANIDSELSRTIRSLIYKAQGLANATGRESYRTCVVEVVRALTPYVTRPELDRLATTPTFWHLQGEAGFAFELLQLEVAELVERLQGLERELQARLDSWAGSGHVVVVDTNVFLHIIEDVDDSVATTNWRQLAGLDEDGNVTVVVPITVLDELDKAKHSKERGRARRVLREISRRVDGPRFASLSANTTLQIAIPPLGHVPLPVADDEIIDQVRQLRIWVGSAHKIRLLTADTGMAMRARFANVDVLHLEQRAEE